MIAALLLVYVALSFLNDDHGFLGTDTGGKVATLRTMARHDQVRPDVGYWAEVWDPQGVVHPLFDTVHIKGRWVQVTTLPMLYAALPLYRAFGYRGALALPMLGSVAAALAAAALARRLGCGRPWVVFWVVGLASPLTLYAVDFWEHSIGVALLLWTAVVLYDAIVDARPWRGLVAGALVGAAFLLRTEALLYGGLGGLLALLIMYRHRRRIRAVVRFAVEYAIGTALLVGLGACLELATVGRLIRLSRAQSAAETAGSGGGRLPGSRVSDAIATTVNLRGSLDTASYLAGAVAVGAIAVVVWRLRRPDLPERERRLLVGFAVLAGALYAIRMSEGLGFVPGLFAATPVAIVAVAAGWGTAARRTLTAFALAALPFMWMFQFVGGATPQWGGRYELPSTMLLLVVGLVALESMPTWIVRSLLALSLVVTAFGVLWLHERSHSVADAMRAVQRLPQPVLVSDVAHLFREGAAFYDPSNHWLTAVDRQQQDRAADVVRRAGYREFGFITIAGEAPREFAGYQRGSVQTIALFSDVDLRVTTYDAIGP